MLHRAHSYYCSHQFFNQAHEFAKPASFAFTIIISNLHALLQAVHNHEYLKKHIIIQMNDDAIHTKVISISLLYMITIHNISSS